MAAYLLPEYERGIGDYLMAYGKSEQRGTCWYPNEDKPWRMKRRSGFSSQLKRNKHKVERRRAKINPECAPEYKTYCGGMKIEIQTRIQKPKAYIWDKELVEALHGKKNL